MAVLDQCLRQTSEGAGGNRIVPFATLELIQSIMGLRFAQLDIDNLTDGISIFSIVASNLSARTNDESRVHAHNLCYDRDGAHSLADIGQILNHGPSLPGTSLEAMDQRKGYSTLLDTLFGREHPLNAQYRQYVEDFGRFQGQLENYLLNLPGGAKGAMTLLPNVLRFDNSSLVSTCWI